jgi:hypothetical protein
MIFSVQRFLEDYFHRCGFGDTDQYAVSLATLYDRKRQLKTVPAFLSAMKHLRTGFYKRNERLQRAAFEKKLLTLLDSEFKKKELFSSQRRSRQELKLRASA